MGVAIGLPPLWCKKASMDTEETIKYEVAQSHRRLLVYRLHSRYPYIQYDTMLDLYNDVVCGFVRHFQMERIEQKNVVFVYLHRSLRNACLMFLRDNRDVLLRLPLLSIDDFSTDNEDEEEGHLTLPEVLIVRPFDEAEDVSYSEYIYQLILQGFNTIERVMIHRYYIEELSLVDVAKELNIINIWKATRMMKKLRSRLAARLLEIKQLRKEGVLV